MKIDDAIDAAVAAYRQHALARVNALVNDDARLCTDEAHRRLVAALGTARANLEIAERAMVYAAFDEQATRATRLERP
jgi:hypothetical protein